MSFLEFAIYDLGILLVAWILEFAFPDIALVFLAIQAVAVVILLTIFVHTNS